MNKENISKIKQNIKKQFKKEKNSSLSEFIELKSHEIIESSELFDEEFYLSHYPEVKFSKFDPIDHFLKFGVKEKCNPNEYFDVGEYFEYFLEGEQISINPFVHFILYGIENNSFDKIILKKLEKKYKVSIIMPTYNRKQIISKSIDSVINQTFENFELIIVDDGSSDGTDEFIYKHYAPFLDSKKIKYYKLNHNGVSAARNAGLNNSSGNIIAYLDSDNQWDCNYLHIMLNELNVHENSNCAYCGVKVNNRVKNKKYVLNNSFNRKKLLKSNFIDLNGFIHKKQLYINRGGFDTNLKRLVDWDLLIRYTKNNPPLHVEKVLVNYIIDTQFDNITITEPLENNWDIIQEKHWKEIYEEEYEIIVDYFDQGFYLEQYEDIFNANIPPIYHYLSKGHKEGRNPNKEFITSFYKNKYPDVVKNNLNPFIHYIKSGQMEGREINYFKEKNNILDNNLLFLSNYEFDYEPLVSIIVLNRNGLRHLKILFKDFSKNTNYSNFEIIVVDNGSDDGSVEFLKNLKLPITVIENKENVSFAKGNNDAVKIAKGEYLLLLNNDIEPTYGWLNELMGTIVNNDNVGAVGAKLLYPYIENPQKEKYSFSIQHAGDIFRENINNGCLYEAHNQNKFLKDVFDNSISVNRKCLLVTGAVLLTKMEIYKELGGLDENYWYGYEDIDFNLRLYQHGYDVIFASAALLFHHESATPKKSRYLNNHHVLCKKWGSFLFKKLLNDKISKDYFFTDKKLNFLFIAKDSILENSLIHNLNEFYIKNGYVTNLNLNLYNMNIDSKVDIIVSFCEEYDVKNIHARENIIKLLVLSKHDFDIHKDYSPWDIIICDDYSIFYKLKCKYKEVAVYRHRDFSKLGEYILQDLCETFLKEDRRL